MTGVTQLGYLGLGAKDLDEWRSYAERTLGLETVAGGPGGTMLLRMDSNHHRFALQEDTHDDILYSGWQVESAAEMDAIAARLEADQVVVTRGRTEDAGQRHVTGLIKFHDPDGHALEVFYGPEMSSSPFHTPKEGTGFIAGDRGLGHFVLAVDDIGRTMAFYTGMLGMKVSDYITQGRLKLGFLHCNPRHHSIAFVEYPGAPKRANHFMLQLDDIDAVGRTWDRVQEGAAPIILTLGRHSNDEMVSFYMRNPSGFGVEYGWGAREIDDSCWQVTEYNTTSWWGHKSPPRPPAPGA